MKKYIKYDETTKKVIEYAPSFKDGISNYNSVNNHDALTAEGYEYCEIENGIDGVYIKGYAISLTEEEIAEENRLRIQELKMTRSDFFDGTIMAFKLNKDSLMQLIEQALPSVIDPSTGEALSETTLLVVKNHFDNALHFYRKHLIFTYLSEVPLTTLPDGTVIKVTADQWDSFFDEKDKGNAQAFLYLLPEQFRDSV